MSDGHDGVRAIGEALGGLMSLILQGAAHRRLEEKARREQQRAKREALKEARASEKQQQEWLKKIKLEKTFGDAGNATEEEAMEMARGRIGRRNPLDDRKF